MVDNWTLVDMIFREFYTGSETDLTEDERSRLEELFSTRYQVRRLFNEGNPNQGFTNPRLNHRYFSELEEGAVKLSSGWARFGEVFFLAFL